MLWDISPLAITQADAFITENSVTLTKYLEMFHANDSDMQDLLYEDLGDLRRDSGSQNSIFRTWKLSFDQISKQKMRATEMPSLMSVLDPQGIPESLLRRKADRNIDVRTALGTLQAFSLISAQSNGMGYGIHRLVHLATQRWLQMQGTIRVWQEHALLVVATVFPLGIFDNWPEFELLLPHAQRVTQYKDACDACPKPYSVLLTSIAVYDICQGRYEVACTKSLAAFDVARNVFGLDLDTLNTMSILASTHSYQGRWEEAEKLHRKVMETRLRVLKADHRDTLISTENLVSIYRNQGQWNEAEKLQKQVKETGLKVLKADHPDTLFSMHNLALIYQDQGRWDETEATNTST